LLFEWFVLSSQWNININYDESSNSFGFTFGVGK